ncbi:MAG: electron transport complex subunit RsxC [Alistipes sp.]|jgi:electron transport complex protein RnfC|nr:electron transport complex subunit RsxC [Alistipes sp.]MBO7242845.1 electron transport complex subunit RsxC [Alistipes sp.]
MNTFPIGGIHPSDNKEWSKDKAIEVIELPNEVLIPMIQHIGAPATPIVQKGDRVLTGQLIGQATGFVSANIHSPISGTVTAIDAYPNGQGQRRIMIAIKREGDEWLESIDRSTELKRECNLSSKEIIEKVKDAGIVGLGGAQFPTHVKLSIPDGQKAEMLIVNGVECEPYLTSDYRNMLERAEMMLTGVEILMRALNVERAVIGVENNKPDAIAHLEEVIARDNYRGIEVMPLKMRYPQGGEKQLIAAVTGRQVAPPPALPISEGVVVSNVSTAIAVYEAVQKNKPLIERVVTITGKHLGSTHNFLTRLGTPLNSLLDLAGGLPEGDVKLLNGGPMMGRAIVDITGPINKGCSGITILSGKEAARGKENVCIKCAKCVEACPMGLEPYLLSKLAKLQKWDMAEEHNTIDCIECGCCSYTCPSYIPLLDYIRIGKQTVMTNIRARATANKK